jgi:peptide/nickel transport system substrate-binding protein
VRVTKVTSAGIGFLLASAAVSAISAEAKTLRLNVVADPAQIDPITVSELVAGDILENVYEGFTEVEPDGSVKKLLAESWEPLSGESPGFRFHLRKGVKFQLAANSPPKT